jgi:hypothetical protein
MFRYLPRRWKLRCAAAMALLFMVTAGLPVIFSVALVLAVKLWPVLVSMTILVLACRILARWR